MLELFGRSIADQPIYDVKKDVFCSMVNCFRFWIADLPCSRLTGGFSSCAWYSTLNIRQLQRIAPHVTDIELGGLVPVTSLTDGLPANLSHAFLLLSIKPVAWLPKAISHSLSSDSLRGSLGSGLLRILPTFQLHIHRL